MDPEKSSNSSFEDLSNINENELNEKIPSKAETAAEDEIMDVLGNGQLTKKTIISSTDEEEEQLRRGEICKINYIGKLENGTVVDEKTNFSVQIGDMEVVQGLDMTLPLMKVGEKSEVCVNARFGYGTIGLKNEDDPSKSIPPGAKLIYEIEVIECKEQPEIEDLSFGERKEIGNRKRERGNFWYSRNEFNTAIQLYRRALDYLDDTGKIDKCDDISNAELQEVLEIRIKVYNNLAAAQMKISAYDVALVSVDNVLRCQPENVKALFRKGTILDAKGDTNAAIPVLQKAAMIDSESKAIQQLLSKCVMKSRREARNEKDLYQKMLGHAQKMEEKSKRTKQKDPANVPTIKVWGYVMGSILIGVAGVAIYRYKYF